MTRRRVLAATALALALPLVAVAQEPYPSRPITLVAPFPPGGVADLTARPVAAAMEKVLKNPVAVVNKTGAAGAVGMQFVATSKPDGYTLLLALSSISIIPEADKIFGRPPAFTVDQFAPIALISADPTILVVRAESPWNTARDFIDDAQEASGQISYSSSGIYGTLHMAMELLSHAAGVKLRHIPTAGAGPALTALLGGHVDALASGPAVILPQIKAGKLRALAGWGDKRVAALPEVPPSRSSAIRTPSSTSGPECSHPRERRNRYWRSCGRRRGRRWPSPTSRRRWTSWRRPSPSSRATSSSDSSTPTRNAWPRACARWGASRTRSSDVPHVRRGRRDVRATLLCVMAILKVARLGHPVLRQKALAVSPGEIRSAGIQRLIDDMVETMREYDGAGLAANQVHTLLQIAVIEVDANPRYPSRRPFR